MNLFRKLTTKSWLVEQGKIDDLENPSVDGMPALKMFVWLFMAVVTVLFLLLFVAYHMRREYADWVPLVEPTLLWINTGLLMMASIALQWAWNSAVTKDGKSLKLALIVGGIFTFAFVIGQLTAWQQLGALGYYASTNPSNAFFYVITGLHAVHILGGLMAWAVTAGKLLSDVEIEKIELNVELCAEYWHFLLLVWIVMFGLMLTT